jgi:hypothetical protein
MIGLASEGASSRSKWPAPDNRLECGIQQEVSQLARQCRRADVIFITGQQQDWDPGLTKRGRVDVDPIELSQNGGAIGHRADAVQLALRGGARFCVFLQPQL